MEFYASTLGVLRDSVKQKKALQSKVKILHQQLVDAQQDQLDRIEAQKLLSTVSDENTQKTLDFVTSKVNRVLAEMLPSDPLRVKLNKKLFAGSKPHIVVELLDSEDNVFDPSEQVGDGVKQVISFMYVICLIEIRKARRLVLADEVLNGLHKQAKLILSRIIELLTENGFQFIMSEYSLNDLGKIYNVEKRGKVATMVALEGDYDDTLVYLDDVDLSLMEKGYTEEEEEYE